ncbi:MAG TPA: helix-turn-helix transcriptional regulator [Candidatus Deferrimicrobium sp.]|nr:helix-turn-helix transcriptional regulator [Candidatus Kapabacteria bacterium]HLP60699.1 helix-turn-helix transcriptional regulator [Candidatus Deferrimicrobium sp.]
MSDFRKFLKENLENDPEFKEIWEKNTQKRELVKTIIALRIKEHLTQEDLAEKMGTRQSAISRLENGNYNPSVDFLFRLAKALNRKVEINFI